MRMLRKIKDYGHAAYITASSVTERDIMDAFGQKWKDFVRTPAEWLEEAGM